MAVGVESKSLFWKSPMFWGAVATLLVMLLAFFLGASDVCPPGSTGNERCPTKWSLFLASPPNEVGDALAGFAGALAFIWLIATVVLQGQELREQRKEFAKMANAQLAQSDVLNRQAEIFESEQRQRNEDEAKRHFEADLELLANIFEEQKSLYEDNRLLLGGVFHRVTQTSNKHRLVRELVWATGKHSYELEMLEDVSFTGFGPDELYALRDLKAVVSRINENSKNFSQSLLARYDYLNFDRLEKNLVELLARPEWDTAKQGFGIE